MLCPPASMPDTLLKPTGFMNQRLNKTFNKLWSKAIGGHYSTPLEIRIFNAVLIITSFLVAIMAAINFMLGLYVLGVLLSSLLFVSAGIYYCSRMLHLLKTPLFLFALFMYMFLIFNFQWNSGSSGPTDFCFILTFVILMTCSPKQYYKYWIFLHLAILMVLFILERRIPDFAPNTYLRPDDKYIDQYVTYCTVIVFTCLITNYLKQQYDFEKKIVSMQASAIREHHTLIEAQHQQLTAHDQYKTRILSIISHDIRHPLAAQHAYLQLLNDGAELSTDEKNNINQELLKLSEASLSMLDNLLTWGQSQLKQMHTQLVPIRLRELVEENLVLSEHATTAKHIDVTLDIPEHTEVMADENLLGIVLRNVMHNAIKFSPEESTILIQLSENDRRTSLSIHDKGIGMNSLQLAQLLNGTAPSRTGTNHEKGSGLGIVLAMDFMKRMHGELAFESETGRGTTVTLLFPRHFDH